MSYWTDNRNVGDRNVCDNAVGEVGLDMKCHCYLSSQVTGPVTRSVLYQCKLVRGNTS